MLRAVAGRPSREVIETAAVGDPVIAANRRKVKAYFKANGPDRVLQILLVGVPAFLLLSVLVGFVLPRPALAYVAMFASLVFVAAAVHEFGAMRREHFVGWVAGCDFERAQTLALERLQLTAANLRDPKCCAFLGIYREDGDYGAAFLKKKVGKDERTRWTPHEIACVYVGHEQLWIHHCAIDLTTGAALYERTREIFFSDIVSVILDGKRITRPMPGKRAKAIKASRYWATRGGVVLKDSLQFDGLQQLSLALANGEGLLPIATWEGSRDSGQPDDAVRSREAALRLRSWVELAKRKSASVAPSNGTRPPSIIRQPSRHQA
jgi:hypothetical protein